VSGGRGKALVSSTSAVNWSPPALVQGFVPGQITWVHTWGDSASGPGGNVDVRFFLAPLRDDITDVIPHPIDGDHMVLELGAMVATTSADNTPTGAADLTVGGAKVMAYRPDRRLALYVACRGNVGDVRITLDTYAGWK
jgi:hypothetical protein